MWNLPSDSVLPETVSRYGHSAVEVNRSETIAVVQNFTLGPFIQGKLRRVLRETSPK